MELRYVLDLSTYDGSYMSLMGEVCDFPYPQSPFPVNAFIGIALHCVSTWLFIKMSLSRTKAMRIIAFALLTLKQLLLIFMIIIDVVVCFKLVFSAAPCKGGPCFAWFECVSGYLAQTPTLKAVTAAWAILIISHRDGTADPVVFELDEEHQAFRVYLGWVFLFAFPFVVLASLPYAVYNLVCIIYIPFTILLTLFVGCSGSLSSQVHHDPERFFKPAFVFAWTAASIFFYLSVKLSFIAGLAFTNGVGYWASLSESLFSSLLGPEEFYESMSASWWGYGVLMAMFF